MTEDEIMINLGRVPVLGYVETKGHTHAIVRLADVKEALMEKHGERDIRPS